MWYCTPWTDKRQFLLSKNSVVAHIIKPPNYWEVFLYSEGVKPVNFLNALLNEALELKPLSKAIPKKVRF